METSITPITNAEIVELYVGGLSTTKIRAQYGVSLDRIRTALRKAGVKARGPLKLKITDNQCVTLYESGKSMDAIIRENGGCRKTLGKILKRIGVKIREPGDWVSYSPPKKPKATHAPVVPPYQFDPVADAKLTPEVAIRLHFDAMMSVNKIAALYGSTRCRVNTMLRHGGRKHRALRDAQLVRQALATPEERLANALAAHAAVRGAKRSPKSIAQGVAARSGEIKSDYERAILHAMTAAGYDCKPGHPVAGFLVDVAIPREQVAVEVDGGNWHSTARKTAQDQRKADALSAAGWRTVRARVRSATKIGAAIDKLLTDLQGIGVHPPRDIEHRMLGSHA